MKDKNENIGAVLGKAISRICTSLILLFCVLRACDVITWKWYWVMMPWFVSEGLALIALIIVGCIAAAHIKDD